MYIHRWRFLKPALEMTDMPVDEWLVNKNTIVVMAVNDGHLPLLKNFLGGFRSVHFVQSIYVSGLADQHF